MTNYNDGKWHGWNGGACPVHPETVVEVQFDTDRDVEKAKNLEWQHQHEGTYSDIIAFRIIKEYKEPMEVWMKWSECLKDWMPCNRTHEGAVLFREVLK